MSDMDKQYDTQYESDTGINWNEVRTGIPAEELAGVPDDAITYYCLVADNGSEHVTLYHTDDEAYLVYGDEDDTTVEELDKNEDDTVSIAQDVAENWSEHFPE